MTADRTITCLACATGLVQWHSAQTECVSAPHGVDSKVGYVGSLTVRPGYYASEHVWLDPSLLAPTTDQGTSPWVSVCPFLSACNGGTLREVPSESTGCDIAKAIAEQDGRLVPPANATCGLEGSWSGALCRNGTDGVLWYADEEEAGERAH